MRFTTKKSYKVTAKDKQTKFIASTYDSFSRKAQVLYWAKRAAANAHRTLAYVQVFCEDDNEVAEYLPSGRAIKQYRGCW